MFGDLYSMEADNDEIDVCMKSQVNDETAVTEAGTDTKATDVSNIDTKTEAHNELASTGGVATGSDTSDMEMDPVGATEAYCFKTFSLSAEEMSNSIESCIEEAETASDNEPEDNSDPELEAVGMNNAGVSTDDPAKVIPDETPADNANITPDADESKDDGEGDADAPLNPIPPALPTSEENWDFSLEGMPMYSLESLEKYRKMVEVSSIDEYFKDPSVKANLDKLIITLKNKKWKSLTKSGIKDLKKALFSKGIPNSEKIKSAKEKGINISVSDYKYKTLNAIIERCKIDDSDVATVVICYDVGGKYKVHYFGDMMFVKKSKEDLEYEESEENWEFSSEDFEQSEEKMSGYFKAKDFKIAKEDRVKGGYKKLAFNNASEFLKSEIGKSKLSQFKEDVKNKGLTFATKKEIQTQKPTLGNLLIRGLTPTNEPGSFNRSLIKVMDIKFIETDGIIFGTWSGENWFSIAALVKMKNGKIGTKGYGIAIPCRVTEEIKNIDSKETLSRESAPYTDFI